MSNESFWKTIEKRVLPTDREPPLWTMIIIVVLLFGIASWLRGLPWQGALPITLFLLLLAIGGQRLSKRLQRESYDTLLAQRGYYFYKKPMTSTEKTRNSWISFWCILILIPVYLSMRISFEAIYQYSWPMWWLAIPLSLIIILIIIFVLLYKRSKKMYETKQQDEKNPPNNSGNA